MDPSEKKSFLKLNLSDKDKKILLHLKKPWVIITITISFILILMMISINDIMQALLHSREEVRVPDLERTSLIQALSTVSEKKLSLIQDGSEFDESLPAGTIVRQHPAPGIIVREGRAIRVVISKGGQVVFVPRIVGIALAEGQSKLASDGLQLGAINEMYSPDFSNGVTMSQEPSSGTVVTRGALVDVIVSKGAPPSGVAVVPNFIGMGVEQVREWAEENGATVKILEDPKAAGSAGTVVRQRPPEDQPLLNGRIKITVVPLLASEQGFRLTYKVPKDQGEVDVRIKARSNRGEFQVYEGKHKGGDKIEIPMSVESTTRVRIFLNDRLKQERLVEP